MKNPLFSLSPLFASCSQIPACPSILGRRLLSGRRVSKLPRKDVNHVFPFDPVATWLRRMCQVRCTHGLTTRGLRETNLSCQSSPCWLEREQHCPEKPGDKNHFYRKKSVKMLPVSTPWDSQLFFSISIYLSIHTFPPCS